MMYFIVRCGRWGRRGNTDDVYISPGAIIQQCACVRFTCEEAQYKRSGKLRWVR